MSAEFFRKYIDIIDEAKYGVMVRPGGPGEPDDVMQPRNQEQRDAVAAGLKKARSYNRDFAKYAAQFANDKWDPNPARDAENQKILQARSRGRLSGSVWQPNRDPVYSWDANKDRPDIETGMPIDVPSWPGGQYQARAIDTAPGSPDRSRNYKVDGGIRANRGKPNRPKEPPEPW